MNSPWPGTHVSAARDARPTRTVGTATTATMTLADIAQTCGERCRYRPKKTARCSPSPGRPTRLP